MNPDLGALGPYRGPFQFGRHRATYDDFARHRRDTPRDRDRFLSMTPRGIVAGETWEEFVARYPRRWIPLARVPVGVGWTANEYPPARKARKG